MKKLANTFFKVAKILDIVAIVLYAFFTIVNTVGLINEIKALAVHRANGAEEYIIQEGVLFVAYGVFYVIFTIVCIALCVVALILVNKCKNTLNTAKTKAEAKKMAIVAIVTGALSTGFAAVAGILMLCMKDEDYAGNVVEVKEVE